MKAYKINPEPIEDGEYLVAYDVKQYDVSIKYSSFKRAYFDGDYFRLLDDNISFPIKPDIWIEMPDPNDIVKQKDKCSCGCLNCYLYKALI